MLLLVYANIGAFFDNEVCVLWSNNDKYKDFKTTIPFPLFISAIAAYIVLLGKQKM